MTRSAAVNREDASTTRHYEGELSRLLSGSCCEDTEGALKCSRAGVLRMIVTSAECAPGGGCLVDGRIADGSVSAGDVVRILPAGTMTRVIAVRGVDSEIGDESGGGRVSLMLDSAWGIGCGDFIVAADSPPEVADQFEAKLLWLAEQPMTPGRQYLLKLACQETIATVTALKYLEEADSGAQRPARTLAANEVAVVNLSTNLPLVFEPYPANRDLGSFVLFDRTDLVSVGVGVVNFALRRASNIHWQALALDKGSRAAIKRQEPRCVWFTGLSGSGKSTIANLLEKRLHALGRHTYLLDGDNVRHGLNRDLGFTEADRVENIRRVAEVAKLMVDAGLIVLVSFISPFRSERSMARQLFAEGEFVEVYVDTPIDVCEQRDVKGLYAKARRGELRNFTGIDSPYQAPERPELHLRAAHDSPDACVERILAFL